MHELRRWRIIQLDDDYVRLSRSGQMLAKSTIGRQLKRRAVAAGVRVVIVNDEATSLVSPHALRRTLATILLNDRQQIDAVADVLGHRFIDTTRTHSGFTSTARRRATTHAFEF